MRKKCVYIYIYIYIEREREIVCNTITTTKQTQQFAGPFGSQLGIEGGTDQGVFDLMNPDARSQAFQGRVVDSAAAKWLYIRCAVGCLQRNMTACQCVSNLCVLQLYDDTSTVCRFVTELLYKDKQVVPLSEHGKGVEGLPWLLYAEQRPVDILRNPALLWRFIHAFC